MRAQSVLIVHRQTMVAEGLAAALARFAGIIPVGIATSARDGELQGVKADAVAFDRRLPGAEDSAHRLRGKGVRVVLLDEDPCDVIGAFVSTTAPVASLASALVPESAPRQEASIRSRLTPREQEVMSLVVTGLAGKQVAKRLGISPKTVEQHKTRIFAKLGVPNQTAAACIALAAGIGSDHAHLAHRSLTQS
ncbi:MAG: response regulator transcription factor [Actinomycetota bacterium]